MPYDPTDAFLRSSSAGPSSFGAWRCRGTTEVSCAATPLSKHVLTCHTRGNRGIAPPFSAFLRRIGTFGPHLCGIRPMSDHNPVAPVQIRDHPNPVESYGAHQVRYRSPLRRTDFDHQTTAVRKMAQRAGTNRAIGSQSIAAIGQRHFRLVRDFKPKSHDPARLSARGAKRVNRQAQKADV